MLCNDLWIILDTWIHLADLQQEREDALADRRHIGPRRDLRPAEPCEVSQVLHGAGYCFTFRCHSIFGWPVPPYVFVSSGSLLYCFQVKDTEGAKGVWTTNKAASAGHVGPDQYLQTRTSYIAHADH